jgi:hypothetical protein
MLPTKFRFIWPNGFSEAKKSANQKQEYFLNSSPLKPLGQMNRNSVGSIYGQSSIKSAHFVLIGRFLKIDASYQVSVHLAKRFQKRRI